MGRLGGDVRGAVLRRTICAVSSGNQDRQYGFGWGCAHLSREEPLLRCTVDICEKVAPAVEEPLMALGRLKDGTIWALEQRGSLLLDDGTENTPGAWYDFTERRVQFSSFCSVIC